MNPYNTYRKSEHPKASKPPAISKRGLGFCLFKLWVDIGFVFLLFNLIPGQPHDSKWTIPFQIEKNSGIEEGFIRKKKHAFWPPPISHLYALPLLLFSPKCFIFFLAERADRSSDQGQRWQEGSWTVCWGLADAWDHEYGRARNVSGHHVQRYAGQPREEKGARETGRGQGGPCQSSLFNQRLESKVCTMRILT